MCLATLIFSIHPLKSASQAAGQPLNFLYGIKMQSIVKHIVFIAFLS
jgi:hypothetical protein